MKDILLKDNDLDFCKGDFSVGESANQSVEHLLISSQGEWKEMPETGADIASANNGAIDRFMDRRIRVQLESDGFVVSQLEITEKGINLNGEYK